METGQRVIITGAPNPEVVRILLEAILAWKLEQQPDTDKPSVAKKDGG